MRSLIVLGAVLAIALAEGQFYVPRAYYTIDSAGHESIPVPLQRLRRSYNPYPSPQPQPQPQPYPGGGSWSNSDSGANAWSHSGSGSSGGWMPPPPAGGYGAAAPNFSSGPGHVYGNSGTFDATPPLGSGLGASPGTGSYVSARASISVDPSGRGRYQNTVGTYP